MGAAFKESFHPFTKLQKIYLITYFKWYLANMVGFIWEGFDETHCQVFVLFLNKKVFIFQCFEHKQRFMHSRRGRKLR